MVTFVTSPKTWKYHHQVHHCVQYSQPYGKWSEYGDCWGSCKRAAFHCLISAPQNFLHAGTPFTSCLADPRATSVIFCLQQHVNSWHYPTRSFRAVLSHQREPFQEVTWRPLSWGACSQPPDIFVSPTLDSTLLVSCSWEVGIQEKWHISGGMEGFQSYRSLRLAS